MKCKIICAGQRNKSIQSVENNLNKKAKSIIKSIIGEGEKSSLRDVRLRSVKKKIFSSFSLELKSVC